MQISVKYYIQVFLWLSYVDSPLPNVEENQLTYPYACDRCPRKFDKRQGLKAHYVTHIQVWPLIWFCDFLVYHLLFIQETPLTCTECCRVYIRRDCLLRHLRTKHQLSPEEALEVGLTLFSNEVLYLFLNEFYIIGFHPDYEKDELENINRWASRQSYQC